MPPAARCMAHQNSIQNIPSPSTLVTCLRKRWLMEAAARLQEELALAAVAACRFMRQGRMRKMTEATCAVRQEGGADRHTLQASGHVAPRSATLFHPLAALLFNSSRRLPTGWR